MDARAEIGNFGPVFATHNTNSPVTRPSSSPARSCRFSLVTVTTDRLPLTERLFRSLAAQTHRDFEILFVHGPACPEGARALAEQFPRLDIRLFASRDHCLSRSRNLALPHVTGDVVAFPDDDCVYEPDTLARCADAFLRSPRPDAVLGRTADMDEDIIPTAASGFIPCASLYALFRHSVSYAQFYAAGVVRAVGGFDEKLGVGCDTPDQSGEDTDYVFRAFEKNFAVVHAPFVVVRHPAVNPRDRALEAKVRAYANGRMRLLRKYRLPWWFVLANIAYPLSRIPGECLRACRLVVKYRWDMFTARLGTLQH
ncbi:MAG: glycosyltransferase [Desulfovibrio sp.]|nr:glycosyltransferase [Desulfovibrio sp.]